MRQILTSGQSGILFATSHGKNACDGVGGTVKRLAARSSLKLVYNDQIMTPRQLYNWAETNITSVNFAFATSKQYEEEDIRMKERKILAKPIIGTQKLHSFIPLDKHRLLVKAYSFSKNSSEEVTAVQESDDIAFEDVVGFITCKYDQHWWLGCVLNSNEETQEMQVSFLHPHGPSPSFSYPSPPDILWIHQSQVMTKVDPVTPTGRVYTLTVEEITAANTRIALK